MTYFRIFSSAIAMGAALSLGHSAVSNSSGEAGYSYLDWTYNSGARCGNPNKMAKRRNAFQELGKAYAATGDISNEAGALPARTLAHFEYEVSTHIPQAQHLFNTGLSYTANFNHPEAVAVFKNAQAIDPNCAMCYWGEAFALGSNINAGFSPDTADRAMEAAKIAVDLASNSAAVSKKEQALIAALRSRYEFGDDNAVVENPDAFADAMDAVARSYPDDDLIQALAAEANMDTQPWDYWEPGGDDPRGRTARTIELLETVLDRNPNFAPAIHLYIHITEASNDPFRAESYADRLGDLDLQLGHLVHMPSHTYYRLGRWEKSLKSNIKAVAVDEAYIESGLAAASYSVSYFPHNVHFAMTTAQMTGDKDTAMVMADKLGRIYAEPVAGLPAWVKLIEASPMLMAVQFDNAENILAMPERSENRVFNRALWHYARGEALARSGDPDAALAEADKIDALMNAELIAEMEAQFVPASDILRMASLTVRARASAAKGDLKKAIDLMEDAVEIQAAMPYTEPPYWYYPSKQTLGALLLRDGQYDRAEWVLFQALVESPDNAYVLHGLAETYAAKGDRRGEKHARGLFKDAWMGGRGAAPDITRL